MITKRLCLKENLTKSQTDKRNDVYDKRASG